MGDQEKHQPAEPAGSVSPAIAWEDAGAPTTQQMRTVGQRRREAERKLDLHLEEARHKGEATEDGDHSEG